jgi:hypothetical protein
MKKEITDLLDLWCWATFTEGRFMITRFYGDELLAEVSVDEFFRNSTDMQLMGVTPADIPEGVEYLVPSRRYTDPEERHKQYAKYIDPDKKPRGYLRWIELALIALSTAAGSKAHKAIEAYGKSKR